MIVMSSVVRFNISKAPNHQSQTPPALPTPSPCLGMLQQMVGLVRMQQGMDFSKLQLLAGSPSRCRSLRLRRGKR